MGAPVVISNELRVLVEAEVEQALKNMKAFDSALGDTEKKTGTFGEALTKMEKKALILSGVITAAAGAAVKFAGENERLKVSLEVMLGSAAKASAVFEEWKKFGASTPLSVEEIAGAGKALLAFGVSSDTITDTLRRLGDVAQGVGSRLADVADIYGKARVQGRLFTNDINQFQGRGIPIVAALAKELGTTEAAIKDMVSEGKIGFPELEKAFISMTSNGGKFEGMMEKISSSTLGRFSAAADNAGQAAASFGELLLPAANRILDFASQAFEALINMDDGTKRFILGMGGVVAAAGPAIAAFKGINSALTLLGKNPYMLLIGGMVTGVSLITGYFAAQKTEVDKLRESYTHAREEAGKLLAPYKKFGEERILDKRTTEELIKLYPELRKHVKEYGLAVGDASAYIENLNRMRGAKGKGEWLEAYIGTAASVDEAARSIAGLSKEMIQAAKETGNFDLAMSEAAKASGLERRLEYLRTQMDDAAKGTRISADVIIDILQTPINPNAESWADGFVSEAERIKEAVAMLKQPGWRGFQVDLFQDTGWLKEVKEGNTNALIEILKTFTGQDPEVQEQAARIEKELQEILSGATLRAAAPDEKAAPAAKKSWMAWWEEITKVPQELFAGRGREAGSTAGALFVEGLEASLQAKMNVAAALGNTFDFAGALKKEQEEIQKILTGLFSIDPKNIDSAFTGADASVKKLIERFRSNDKALIQMGIEFPVEEVKENVEEIKQEFLSFDEFFADWVSTGIQDFFPQLAEEGAGAFGKIAASMASVSFDGMLRGLEEVGRAFAENENAAAAFRDAMVGMLRQMLDMLPAMFLQAGLQLIIAGNWPLGLAFIAAAASSALIGGYVNGVITREEEEAAEAATANARGNAFDETFIVPYSRGGEFTNRIINSPTFFRHGGGLGLMGEAGPEAVVPLKRLPNGDLGVESPGGGTRVVVNIINNTGEPVTQEESETRDGGRQLDIIIGEIVGAQIAQGRHNNALEAQFEGLRKRGR